MDVGPEDGEHCVSRTILRTPVYLAEWTMVLFIKIGHDKRSGTRESKLRSWTYTC